MNSSLSSAAWLRAMPAVFVLIWSTGFIVARFGMPHAPPFSFLWIRYAFSILCFLGWVYAAKVSWPQGHQAWLHLSVTGILMHAAYLGGVWAAVKAGMGSGLSALIVGLQPVLTALWLSSQSAGSGREVTQVSQRQWMGLGLGFCGLLMVLSNKLINGSPLDHVNPFNLGCALMALCAITLGTLYQKRFVQSCDVRTANTVQLLAALVVTTPLALLETEPLQWNTEFMGAMAWSVLGLTLGGSSLLYLLIQKGAAASVTSLMYLVPPCTAIIAWFLFDEPFTLVILLGIALTAIGVSMVVRAPTSSPPTTEKE